MKTDTNRGCEVGMTLICQQCDLAVVVVDLGDATEAAMTCHAIMKPALPMRCWRVYPQPQDAATVAGALYTDAPSGLTVRCTRPGVGTLRLAGRSLRLVIGQRPRLTTVT